MRAISTGVKGSNTLRRGYIVRSNDFDKVFMVGAEIDGPSIKDRREVGVWATNSKTGNGLIFAVDGMAKEFSDWGAGDKTDAQIDQTADGVDEAKECAGT